MNKKELLMKDWEQSIEYIRFFRDQINKMSLWEFGLLPLIGVGIALKFFSDKNYIFSGLSLIALYFIMGFVDNLAHINARYSLILIKLSGEFEKKIGTNITNKIKEKWDELLEKDKKGSLDKKFDTWFFHINNVRKIKYILLILGIIIIVYSFIK